MNSQYLINYKYLMLYQIRRYKDKKLIENRGGNQWKNFWGKRKHNHVLRNKFSAHNLPHTILTYVYIKGKAQ